MSSSKAVCSDCASAKGSEKGTGVLSKAKTVFKGWINNNKSQGYTKIPRTKCPNCKPTDAKKFTSDSLYIHDAKDDSYHTGDSTHSGYDNLHRYTICRDEIYRYIWGDEAFRNRELSDDNIVIVGRVYSMLKLESSPVLDYFVANESPCDFESLPAEIREALDRAVATHV
ncbi:hypothetical protein F5Y03DRAFT_390366 [Xylaria venustula]|nr:hypothetical protein F5Y03DRAFT_390366 [Xylaria venustula]